MCVQCKGKDALLASFRLAIADRDAVIHDLLHGRIDPVDEEKIRTTKASPRLLKLADRLIDSMLARSQSEIVQ